MFTNDKQNDNPSFNRDSANMINSNPAAGQSAAANQPGAPRATTLLNTMSTQLQPYSADSVIYEKSDNFVQTSAGADVFMPPVNDTFTVPEGGATAVASLTVDDWGKLTISGPGGTFELDLTSAADEPGELGGHQEWSKSIRLNCPPAPIRFPSRTRTSICRIMNTTSHCAVIPSQ